MKSKEFKLYLFLFVPICVIIFFIIKTYCTTTLTLKSITFGNKIYSIYTDCIKFHIKANGYNKKIKEEMPNNFYEYANPGPGRDLQTNSAKMQGYGNYVFKVDTSLFYFIQYCYTLNPNMTTACCLYPGPNEASSCDYTKLCTYSGQVLTNKTKIFIDFFWTNMTAFLGETFNLYQDLYFFEKYTNKGACLVFNTNKLVSDGKEFLTAMTSYIFTTNQNSSPNCEIKHGDIVPFLYVLENTNVSEIKNSPKEIAKYAYLACINGWSESSSNDLWYEEYESIFGSYDEAELCDNIDMTLEELEEWYSKTIEKYENKRGNSRNPLLGATIDTIIKSDYSISQQFEATQDYLETIVGIGDYKENVVRNELMAKYMMENSHIGDVIKDYNVGINFITENLQLGTQEDKNTNTCVLSDFQVLEFDHTLNIDGKSDDDGISDLIELTNITEWVNITVPMNKYYDDMHNQGKTNKDFSEVMDDLCTKQGKYEDSGGNVVWGHLKYEGGKVYYKTRDYDSNPMLNDTDFDGLHDNIDSNKIDGTFKGSETNIGDVEFTSDFRYFFIDNNKYNDELSTMSLMICNLANGEEAPMHNVSTGINSYLKNLGFSIPLQKSTFKISDTENISGNFYLSKKTIQVGANKKSVKRYKDVYGVFLGGFDTEKNHNKLLSNFNKEQVKNYYNNIVEDIIKYVRDNKSVTVNDYCYWVCGYSVAGGIAAEVAAKLKDDGEVYAYTFGATNCNSSGTGAYAEIKNVINEDDLYPKIYNKDDGFSRSGALYNDSIFDNLQYDYKKYIGSNYVDRIKKIDYSGKIKYEVIGMSAKKSNTIKKCIDDVRNTVSKDEWVSVWESVLPKYLFNFTKVIDTFNSILNPIQSYNSVALKRLLNYDYNINGLKEAHSIKSYYVLSKSLNGFDLNNEEDGWSETEDIIEYEEETNDLDYDEKLMSGIMTLAKWYINHIPTYQNSLNSSRHCYYYDSNDLARDYFDNYAEAKDSNGDLLKNPTLRTPDEQKQQNGTAYEEIHLISENRLAYRVPLLEEYANNKETNEKYVYGNNIFSGYTGDDCNAFVMGVIRLVSEGDRGEKGDDKNRLDSTGMQLQNTSAEKMGIDDNFEKAMLNLGYEKYALRGNQWYKFEMVNVGDEVREEREPLSIAMSVNFLQPGDILITDGTYPNGSKGSGHVEFYLGLDFDVTYNAKTDSEGELFIEKNNGIESITIKGTTTQGHNTFGWGRVFNTFPREDSECFYLNNKNSFSICNGKCTNGNHTGGDTRCYKEIWRKVR
ncbi:MAG: hypothetical protein Q4F88_05135 [Eubacteriales bacterium]|nr:hypothetical protein [Eubacteriales bacterium]